MFGNRIQLGLHKNLNLNFYFKFNKIYSNFPSLKKKDFIFSIQKEIEKESIFFSLN